MQDVETPAAAPVAPPTAPPVAEPAPEPTPQEGVAEEAEVASGEEVEGGDAPAAEYTLPDTFEALEEYVKGHAELGPALEERDEKIRKDTQSATQKRLQPLFEKAKTNTANYEAAARQANQSIGTLLSTVQKMEKDGVVEPGELGQAIAQHAPRFVELLSGLTRTKGWYDAMEWQVSQGDPKIAAEFRPRIQTAQLTGADESELKMIAQDYLDAVVAEREKIADDRGYRRGLKDRKDAATKSAKGESRSGAGPDTVSGTAGGNKKYSQMTFEERQALSPDERDRLAAQEG